VIKHNCLKYKGTVYLRSPAIIDIGYCRSYDWNGWNDMVSTVGWQHVYVWQVFYHYGPGWSPIRELVAAAVTCCLSRCVIDFSQCAALSHNSIIYIDVNIKWYKIYYTPIYIPKCNSSRQWLLQYLYNNIFYYYIYIYTVKRSVVPR